MCTVVAAVERENMAGVSYEFLPDTTGTSHTVSRNISF